MVTAAEKARSVISDIVEKATIPSQPETCSSRSLLMQQRGRKLLELSYQTTEVFEKFSSEAVAHLSTVIDGSTKRFKLNASKRESLWAEFHQLRIHEKDKLHALWKELLCQLKVIDDDPLLKQSIYTDLFGLLVKEYVNSQTTKSDAPSASSTELTSDEANALRYACGYVARSILRKYETRKGDVYSQYVQCLGDMAVEGEGSDVLLYTRKWLDQVNRGGLFPLNDSTFTFFVAVEKQVRNLLPRHVIRPSDKAAFKTTVIDKVVQEEDVQFHWALISQDIDKPEDAEALLVEIVKLWVTIRGFSLAASWMEEYKKNNKKTTQKSTGLRKSISGSS